MPATGWPGTKCTPSGRCGCTCAITEALTEPTSVTMAPGFRLGAHVLGDAPASADRHAEDDQIGVAARPPRDRSSTSSAIAEFPHPREPSLRCASMATIVPRDLAVPRRRGRWTNRSARGRPVRCGRRSAFQRQAQTLRHHAPFRKSRKSRDHEAVRLLGADGQAQRIGQSVGIDPPQDQAAGGQESVGILRGLARRRSGNG